MSLWTEVSRDFSYINAGKKLLSQTRIKPSIMLFVLGDCPFMKGKVQRRKRFKLVNKSDLKLLRKN